MFKEDCCSSWWRLPLAICWQPKLSILEAIACKNKSSWLCSPSNSSFMRLLMSEYGCTLADRLWGLVVGSDGTELAKPVVWSSWDCEGWDLLVDSKDDHLRGACAQWLARWYVIQPAWEANAHLSPLTFLATHLLSPSTMIWDAKFNVEMDIQMKRTWADLFNQNLVSHLCIHSLHIWRSLCSCADVRCQTTRVCSRHSSFVARTAIWISHPT